MHCSSNTRPLLPYRRSFAVLLAAGVCASPLAMAQIAGTQATNDTANLYYSIPYSGTPSFVRLFIDQDRNAGTGFQANGIGAGFLVENGNLYRYSGSGGQWGWTFVKQVPYTSASQAAKITIARTDVGSPSSLDLIAQTTPPAQTSAKITQVVSAAEAVAPTVTSDLTNVYYKVPYTGTPSFVRIFIDSDRNTATGFPTGGIGANYLVENGVLYRYSGTNGAWGWTVVRSVTSTRMTGRFISSACRKM